MGPKQQPQPQPSQRKGYSAIGDSFGLLGLQPVVTQASDTQEAANLLLLTRGFDLNQLGLPLVQTESLHTTFSSPWLEPAPQIQPDFKIPQCYMVQSPSIKFALFQRFLLETLFYIFYSMPKDVLQMAAAHELYNRDWRYHKQLRLWITKVPGEEPTVKHVSHERGSFLVWNPDTWQKEKKEDFLLEYAQLEEKADPQRTHQQK